MYQHLDYCVKTGHCKSRMNIEIRQVYELVKAWEIIITVAIRTTELAHGVILLRLKFVGSIVHVQKKKLNLYEDVSISYFMKYSRILCCRSSNDYFNKVRQHR